MSRTDREFDLIIWGATGFTGRLVAGYLAARIAELPELRWALAGRNHNKLEAIRAELGADCAELPLVVADSNDRASLDAMVQRTGVVITTVGPYAFYGTELVRACAANGTDYCDLAGETQWIRAMIDESVDDARGSGARIVHCCGFDSVPFDMGVWAVQQAMYERHGVYARSVVGLMRKMKGSFSGGTFASMMNLMDEAARDKQLRKALTNAGMLLPDARQVRRAPSETRVTWCVEGDTWTAPFVMTPINSRIVQRTNALLGSPWGEDFEYAEGVATGAGIGGRARANAMLAGTGGFMLAAGLPPTRALLKRLLPDPGEGPDQAARENGYYRAEFIARHPEHEDKDVHLTVSGDMDPGYGSTSKIIAECGLCLALDDVDAVGGSWTPASVMGEQLLARLNDNAGVTFVEA